MNSSLSRFLTGEHINDSLVQEIGYELGQLDIMRIQNFSESDFLNLLDYWCFIANTYFVLVSGSPITDVSQILQLIKIANVAVMLTRHPMMSEERILDPIYAMLCGLDNIFMEVPENRDFPLTEPVNFKNQLLFCNVVFHQYCKNTERPSSIITYSIFFALSLSPECPEKLYLFITELTNNFGITELADDWIEMLNQANDYEQVKKFLENIHFTPSPFCFFITSYLAEEMYHEFLGGPRYNIDIFKLAKICPNEDVLYPLLAYISPPRIHAYEIDMNSIPGSVCLLCLRHVFMKEEPEVVLNMLKSKDNLWPLLYHAYYQNVYTGFLPTFFNKIFELEISDEWQKAIDFIRSFSFIPISQDVLIQRSLDGDIQSAIQLSSMPDCYNELQPEKSRIHQILQQILNPQLRPLNENSFDINEAILLFRYELKHDIPSVDYLNNVLSKAIDQYMEKIKKICPDEKLINCIYAGYAVESCPKKVEIVIPTKIEDFFQSSSNDEFFDLNIFISVILQLLLQKGPSIQVDRFLSFTLNYYLPNSIKIMIKDHFNDQLIKDITKIKYEFIKKALEPSPSLLECIHSLFEEIKKVRKIGLHYAVFYLKSNLIEAFKEILISIPDPMNYASNNLSKDKHKMFFDLLVDHDMTSLACDFAKYINEEIVYESIAMKLFTHSSTVISVFYSLQSKKNSPQAILSRLDSLPSVIHTDFLKFLKEIVQNIDYKRFKYSKLCDKPKISVDWGDDEIKSSETGKDDIVDPWEKPMGEHICTNVTANGEKIKQPMYHCYTCGLLDDRGCCLECALSCHKGHDIVFYRSETVTCSCYKIPQMCHHNPNQDGLNDLDVMIQSLHAALGNPSTLSDDQRRLLADILHSDNGNTHFFSFSITQPAAPLKKPKQEIFSIDPEVIFNIFSQLSKCEIIDSPSKSSEVNPKTFKLVQVPTQKLAKSLKLTPVRMNTKLIDSNDFSSSFMKSEENISQLIQRSNILPLSLVAVSGEIAVVANTVRISSYRIPSYDLIDTIIVDTPVVQVKTNPDNLTQVSLLSATEIYLIKIDSNGDFNGSDFSPILTTIPKHQFLLSEYVLNKYLAILSINSLKFISLENRKLVSEYTTTDNEIMQSFIIIPYQNEWYFFITLLSGFYLTRKFAPGENVQINDKHGFPWMPLAPIIRYAKESKLVFVSSSDSDLACIQLPEMFGAMNHVIIKAFDSPAELVFSATHPMNPYLHVFEHPISGGIATVEIRSDCFTFSTTNSCFSSIRLPVISSNKTPLSLFVTNDSLHLLTTDGKITNLQIHADNVHKNSGYKVSPVFWARAVIRDTNIEVAAPNITEHAECVLHGKKLILDHRVVPKVIEIKTSSNDFVIVGFKVSVGSNGSPHRPPYIKLFDRKVHPATQRSFMFPLKHDEIGKGRTYQIEFGSNGGLDINCDGIEVFTASSSILMHSKEGKTHDWLNNGSDIKCFTDNETSDSLLKDCLISLSRSINEKLELNDEQITSMICVMYQKEIFSLSCRRIILKCVKNDEQLYKCWTEAIKKVIKDNSVNKNLWKYLWRDYSLLPDKYQMELGDCIWECNPPITDQFGFFSAFI